MGLNKRYIDFSELIIKGIVPLQHGVSVWNVLAPSGDIMSVG